MRIRLHMFPGIDDAPFATPVPAADRQGDPLSMNAARPTGEPAYAGARRVTP